MIYRPTVLPVAQCANWWRDDRPREQGATKTHVGVSEVECVLCLAEIAGNEPEAPAKIWNEAARLPLKTLWSALLVHLITVHGVVPDDASCPA